MCFAQYPQNDNFSNVVELWEDSNGYPMIEEKKKREEEEKESINKRRRRDFCLSLLKLKLIWRRERIDQKTLWITVLTRRVWDSSCTRKRPIHVDWEKRRIETKLWKGHYDYGERWRELTCEWTLWCFPSSFIPTRLSNGSITHSIPMIPPPLPSSLSPPPLPSHLPSPSLFWRAVITLVNRNRQRKGPMCQE